MTSQPRLPPRSAHASTAAHRAAVSYNPRAQADMTSQQEGTTAVKKCVQFKDVANASVASHVPRGNDERMRNDSDDVSSTSGSYVVELDSTLHGVTV